MSTPNQQRRRRRRPGVGTAVTAAVVAYGTYQLASWAWNRWVTTTDDEYDEEQEQQHAATTTTMTATTPLNKRTTAPPPQQRRQLFQLRKQRMVKCRQDIRKALNGFLPTVRTVIQEATNVSHDKQALKELRLESRKQLQQQQQQQKAVTATDEEGKNNHRRHEEEDHHDGDNKNHARRRAQEQAALWTNIQINTLTRMMATAYAHTILFVVLTVQVHLLGGRLLRIATTTGNDGDDNNNKASPNSVVVVASDDDIAASHRTVLKETYHNFLNGSGGGGLKALLEIVREAVRTVVWSCDHDWNVLDPASALHMTPDKFQAALDRIRSLVEESSSSSSSSQHVQSNILQRIIVPPSTTTAENGDAASTVNATGEDCGTDSVASFLLEETWDLLESPVVNDALQACLDGTFDWMRTQHWGKTIFNNDDSSSEVPLAQVIAQLNKKVTNSFYNNDDQEEEGASPYCAMMESLPSVVELSDVSFN